MTIPLVRLCALVVGLTALAAAAAHADDGAPVARPAPGVASYEANGTKLFDAGRFEEAIVEFRKAYEIEARPTLLFRIGQAYEQLGRGNSALYFYRRFLATAPEDAPERSHAEAVVAATPAPPPAEATPEEPPAAVWTPPHSQDNAEARPAAPSATGHRWWLWAGAAAVAGVALGLVLWSTQDGDVPRSDLGHTRFE